MAWEGVVSGIYTIFSFDSLLTPFFPPRTLAIRAIIRLSVVFLLMATLSLD